MIKLTAPPPFEFVSSEVDENSPTALVTDTAKNITSISLSAGDWDVYGTIGISPAAGTTTSRIIGWISTISATIPTIPNSGGMFVMTLPFTASSTESFSVGTKRISISSTTTVYLSIYASFAVSTNGAHGFIGARRVR